jgi:hypothetical protein
MDFTKIVSEKRRIFRILFSAAKPFVRISSLTLSMSLVNHVAYYIFY